MADDVSTMIEDCEARQSKLSEWEQTFIASIGSQLERGRDLSERQLARLEAIWDRVTG